jgi:lipopolysaccharide/colanic/teichoic acid biosynthesis glycosyltransferase
VDVAGALAGLILLLPVFALVAAAIRLGSTGPVFFRQERIGRHFVPFELLKFRTMRDAPGRPITVGDDARITSVGAVLRRYKLDELPQLWNVLRGDMSLVGPRPELGRFVDQFRDEYRELLSVRPGLTDFASLEYRDESAALAQAPNPEQLYVNRILPDKIRLGRRYVREASIPLDLSLICRTLLAVSRARSSA